MTDFARAMQVLLLGFPHYDRVEARSKNRQICIGSRVTTGPASGGGNEANELRCWSGEIVKFVGLSKYIGKEFFSRIKIIFNQLHTIFLLF